MSKNGKALPDLDDFEVDVNPEVEGEWFTITVKNKGKEIALDVKLRSPHCPDFRSLQGKLHQKRQLFNASGSADVVVMENCFREAVAKKLLIDWRGKAPFSPELAEAIMLDHKYRKLSAGIAAIVRRLDADEEVERANEGKGSEPLSDAV